MADNRADDAISVMPDVNFTRAIRRRRVMLGVGLLLGVVAACAVTIVVLMQQLEVRNASFQPPMTASERQRLLPADPILHTAPQLEGIRYGNHVQYSMQYDESAFDALDDPMGNGGQRADKASTDRSRATNLQVDAHLGWQTR